MGKSLEGNSSYLEKMTLLLRQIAVLVNFISLVYCGILINDENKVYNSPIVTARWDLHSQNMIIDENFGSCSAKNSRFPEHLPHSSDCNKFYLCVNGLPYLKECPPGLHFNPEVKACDYPENAGCDAEYNTPVSWVSEDSGKSKGEMLDDGFDSCPSGNSGFPVHLPHPSDCTKFYICDHGKAHLKECHPGLHFNPKINACDYPENAGCDAGYLGKPKGKMIEDDFGSCPAQNSRFPVYLPHPTDCSKFYICDSGSPHLKDCHPGLHFNPKSNVCDFPENAGCDNGMAVAMAGVPSPYCPSKDGKVPIFYRHPTDCSVFYLCANGFAHEFVCPARLHFNVRKKLCDYERNANCRSVIS